MHRLIIVSNRLPVSVSRLKGKIQVTPSVGGLATGLGSYFKKSDGRWIGWPGIIPKSLKEKEEILNLLDEHGMSPVFLTRKQIDKYYLGFSNKTIWPLFHYFPQQVVYDENYWESYHQVNQLFLEEVARTTQRADMIWVNDYQLMLLPAFLRKSLPDSAIGFFLHIPFPSFELFRTLPWRSEILEGIIGADLIGFHTHDYVRHFISAATRILGIDHNLTQLILKDRTLRADSFPMGIDYESYAEGHRNPDVKKELAKICKIMAGRKVILSIDRLDYSKGIPQRLKAFENLLIHHPKFREKLSMVMVVVPSRSNVEHYQRLKEEVDELVGRINGKYSVIGWTPIWYMYKSLPFRKISALYNAADITLVTPFRDGMNLIAKEYVASRHDGRGVLILSEMAGAVEEMSEAIVINPNDLEDLEQALVLAMTMPEETQILKNREMQRNLKRLNVQNWAENFLHTLEATKKEQQAEVLKILDEKDRARILGDYQRAERRLLLLDYDGTLVPFADSPQNAIPDSGLFDELQILGSNPKNQLVIISGRSHQTLDEWFSKLNIINMVAEHGAWIKFRGEDWRLLDSFSQDWKNEIRPILELFRDRTPGSFVEEKDFSLAWHYRRTDRNQGEIRAREMVNHLVYMTANLNLKVLEGNRVVEVKNQGINKGRATQLWLEQESWDFILSIGDDRTDEDMFESLPEHAFSIKVGTSSSRAQYFLRSTKDVRFLLKLLTEDEI